DSAEANYNTAMTLKPGHYTLSVWADGGFTGSFALALRNLASATKLTLNDVVSGTLNPADRTDLYKFAITAGQQIFFDAQSGNDYYWRLFDPDGQQVFGPAYIQDRGLTTLGKTGTYTLAIEGRYYNSAPMGYTFRVVAPPIEVAGPLQLGTPISGTLSLPGQSEGYSFSLTKPTLLYVDPQTNNGNLNWYLVGPNGATYSSGFRSSDAYSRDYGDPVAFLAAAGDYTLYIYASGDAIGDYAVNVLDLTSGTVIAPGAPVSGTLNPGNSTAIYRFDATAGERYYFDMQSIGGDGRWRLLDPAGRLVVNSARYYDDFASVPLPLTGTYTLLLEGGIDYTGPTGYRFEVWPITQKTETIALNTRIDSAIESPGQTRSFTFSLASATQLFMDVLSPIDNGYIWTLTGPNGVVDARRFVQSDSYNFSGNPLLSLGVGAYTLTITAEADRAAAFSFRLLDVAAATAITPGTPLSGSINPGSETDIYTLDGKAGDRFYFDQQQYSGGSLYWRMIDPYGRVIFQQGFGDVGTVTLPNTGTYVLLLEGYMYDGGGSSTYRFAVFDNALAAPTKITNLEALPGPDLAVTGIGVAATGGIQSGGEVIVTWQDQNNGTLPVTGAWTDRVLIRRVDTNEVIADGQISYDPAAQGNAALASGAALQR
ncbi:MAG: hypothetical protein JSS43_20310, partial [Proteobacteria bacterium]|nr:hypothetical protein [Pseudomonadota bacterium]